MNTSASTRQRLPDGSGNSPEIFGALVGHEITAAFEYDRAIWLVVDTGQAICFHAPRNNSDLGFAPTYWTKSKDDVDRVVSRRREEIKRKIAELGQLGTVAVNA